MRVVEGDKHTGVRKSRHPDSGEEVSSVRGRSKGPVRGGGDGIGGRVRPGRRLRVGHALHRLRSFLEWSSQDRLVTSRTRLLWWGTVSQPSCLVSRAG